MTDQEKMPKPRICEVLGVEVEEEFHIQGKKGSFKVVENGTLGYSCEFPTASEWVNIINHPDRILRKPRFSQEEIEVARSLKKALSTCSIIRVDEGTLWSGSTERSCVELDPQLFPQIRPGTSVKVEEILGGGL